MAGGSWGGGGDTPVHPSAWCKANQGWVEVATPHPDAQLTIDDVKSSRTVYQLWADGAAGTEYFLMENRQQDGFDATLPGSGLLIWHIDESQSGNTDDRHYKVALMQADGKADLEAGRNRGDAGDAYPGTADNREFTATSTPGSKSYAGADSCVGVTQISDPGPTMTANVSLSCPALAAGDA
jgi:immune inhibitor A